MLKLQKENAFVKDLKVLAKKHYNFGKLEEIIDLLMNQIDLPNKYFNHSLTGKLKGYKELHVERDLLLIYKIEDTGLILVRIGNHKDLLNK